MEKSVQILKSSLANGHCVLQPLTLVAEEKGVWSL